MARPSQIYLLSLHDALPISPEVGSSGSSILTTRPALASITATSADFICANAPETRLAIASAIGLVTAPMAEAIRSEEHTSELQSHSDLVCRLLLEKKKRKQ